MVTPAEAQTYAFAYPWIPASAGMTDEIIGRTPPAAGKRDRLYGLGIGISASQPVSSK